MEVHNLDHHNHQNIIRNGIVELKGRLGTWVGSKSKSASVSWVVSSCVTCNLICIQLCGLHELGLVSVILYVPHNVVVILSWGGN